MMVCNTKTSASKVIATTHPTPDKCILNTSNMKILRVPSRELVFWVGASLLLKASCSSFLFRPLRPAHSTPCFQLFNLNISINRELFLPNKPSATLFTTTANNRLFFMAHDTSIDYKKHLNFSSIHNQLGFSVTLNHLNHNYGVSISR
ncbi:hypothetical protein Phum_PHUM357400 [Pediculus humanus corporis]|uniref:Uncharacterized protein n=1 Tax=Pediculus humanus subsp. corporis TaxID=121224 RepID=E0VPD2_PEDHC|nr:uncharacterized protein Phum_PHUM357400 [Pediculus humanus corporis]EEB15238.1 hypothetical protein Phum_PHUM357400 [Pediculus humanus corporis]